MKFVLSFLLYFCLAFSQQAFSQQGLTIPISAIKGYGLFDPHFAIQTVEASTDPYKEDLKGIPGQLKNIERYHIIFDQKQFLVQSYHQKKIAQQEYEQMKQVLNYEPTEKEFSRVPIKSAVYVITGQDEKGNNIWMADTNIDFDFTGEQMRPLLLYKVKQYYDNQDYQQIARKHEEIAKNAVTVKA